MRPSSLLQSAFPLIKPGKKVFRWFAGLAFFLTAFASQAHELPSSRVTLVLRDSHQLSLTLYINYLEVLHKTVAPSQSFDEFVVMHAAMVPAVFKQATDRAHTRLQADTKLTVQRGKALIISHWRWPVAQDVHSALQQRAIQMVLPDARRHLHEPTVEVQAQATSATAIAAVTLKLPKVLQPALLVSYKPAQAWVDARTSTNTVRF